MPTPTPKYRPYYYPFGSSLNTRSFSAGSGFRFGFNGKEKQSEIGGNNYDFGARIYDGSLGRWFSVEPLYSKYPDWTTYQFAFNSPKLYIDKDGYDNIIYLIVLNSAKTALKNTNFSQIGQETNSYLQQMGLTNVKMVVITKQNEVNKLEKSKLAKTDLVVVFGSPTESLEYIRKKDKQALEDIESNGITNNQIEKTQMPSSSETMDLQGHPNGNPGNQWVFINSSTLSQSQFQLGKLPLINYCAFVVLHAAGHSADLLHSDINGPGIINKSRIMDEGNFVKDFFHNTPIKNSLEAKNALLSHYIKHNSNAVYIKQIRIRFNSKVAQDGIYKRKLK